jgi:hypothetical protein
VKKDLTAHSIANTVRMTRSLHKGAFLIVEGDTDVRVYKRFVNEADCIVIPAYNKDKAVEVLEILEKESFEGSLVIVDADFWHLEGIKPGSVNLFLTDTHDLETMILCNSSAWEKILSEFGSTNKIKRLKKTVRDMLLENALLIGLLRWIASPSKDNLSLIFRDLCFENFVDKTGFKVNTDKMIDEVKNNSKKIEIDRKSIKRRIKSLKKENYDPWQVCSGHDMVQLLAIGLRCVFGNRKSKTLTVEVLEGIVRLAYEENDFSLTGLYRSMEKWEKANPTYKVLKT